MLYLGRYSPVKGIFGMNGYNLQLKKKYGLAQRDISLQHSIIFITDYPSIVDTELNNGLSLKIQILLF